MNNIAEKVLYCSVLHGFITLPWRHNGCDSVSNHQPYDCLLNRLFRRRSKKTSKLRVTGLCAGNSPVTGEFPAQMASNAENVSIWWRHHDQFWVNSYGFVRPFPEGLVRWHWGNHIRANEVTLQRYKKIGEYLQVWNISYFRALQSFQMFKSPLFQIKLHLILSYSVDFKAPQKL